MNIRHEVVPTAQDQTGQFLIVHAKRNEDWTVNVTTDRYSSVYEARAAWDTLYMAFRHCPPNTVWLLTPRPDTNELELGLLRGAFGTVPGVNVSSTRPLKVARDLESETTLRKPATALR